MRLAPGGLLVLRSLQNDLPDLILLDIKMPEMDGFAGCARLKADERTRDIPVIFISALGEEQDKGRGFEAGGVDYVTKPFHAGEVLARVETHLKMRRLQQCLEAEVTRRTQAEEELRVLNDRLVETNQQLQTVNASKDTFFSIIAHDLRNPFMTLPGLSEAMIENLEHYPLDKLTHFLRLIHTSAENTYALLTNLLTWSRLERG